MEKVANMKYIATTRKLYAKNKTPIYAPILKLPANYDYRKLLPIPDGFRDRSIQKEKNFDDNIRTK